MPNNVKAILLLEDGTVFEGTSFGAKGIAVRRSGV